MSSFPPAPMASGDAPAPTSGAPSLLGRRLGRYELLDELGRGGMAIVYRARDQELGREVALKVMHGFLSGRDEQEVRFRREARAVASVRHDGIVQLFDFEGPQNGMPAYIVAELVRGPTLKRVIDDGDGRLVPELAALIGARVADALAAAHAHGIVHRDVKPDNIMLEASSDGCVRVLLADFGVAHMTGVETMTATGALVGSPAYMSPEQARGEDVTPASDIFSLGVTMYHACTGCLPFAGKDPLTVVLAVLRGEMKRPSQIAPRVGTDLERIILRCMKANPAERYPDAGALRDELRELAHGAGLNDEPALLRRLLTHPAELERELAPKLAEHAFARVCELSKHGQLTRALNEVNRVFAHVPDHAGARALVERLSSRRRWGHTALIAAGAAAVLLLTGMTARYLMTRRSAEPTHSSAPVTPDTRVSIPSSPGRQPRGGGTAKAVVASPGGPATSSGRTKAARKQSPARAKSHPPETAPAAASPERQPPPASGVTTTGNATSATSPAPRAGTESLSQAPNTGTMEVRAWRGFCLPSVDNSPPHMKPSYPDLPAGPHRIYCTLPQGDRVLVGTYDLRAGTRPSLVIRPDASGRPMLVRPQ